MSNVLSFSTRFGQDGELKTTQGGTDILTVRCPVESGFGDKAHTSWVTAVLFGKRATGLAPYIKKGVKATIWGELRVREFQRNDGSKGMSVECLVDKLDLQSSVNDQPQSQGSAQPSGFDDDSIPF